MEKAAAIAREVGADALGDCGVPSSDVPKLLGIALRNYNANRQLGRHTDTLLACIARTITPR
ncbi:hypothetical protein C2U69_23905 [Cupriavidus pinatubonensis]|nr:hypothetical protein C2U69_23905 [Cupriavidus pinatubonensis]